MTTLLLPDEGREITNRVEIEATLAKVNVLYRHFPQATQYTEKDDETLLAEHRPLVEPHLEIHALDVMRVNVGDPKLQEMRDAFKREHQHSEDEIRFLLHGEGTFWLHAGGQVYGANIGPGDLLRLPAGIKHWFTFPDPPLVTLRFYQTKDGWAATFTGSGKEQQYAHLV